MPNLYQESTERLSGLSFKEAFSLLEHLYFKEKSLSESHHFHVYKIRDFWSGEIQNGKLFEIRKDDRESVPVEGDIVCLRSPLNFLFVRVTYVLHHTEAPDFILEGFFIFGFEIICSYSGEKVATNPQVWENHQEQLSKMNKRKQLRSELNAVRIKKANELLKKKGVRQ